MSGSFSSDVCPCGGRYRFTVRDVPMRRAEVGVLRDVPVGDCQACTGRIYRAEVLRRVEAVLRREPFDPVMTGSGGYGN